MKGSTQKIYQEKTNRVIDYINAHLHEPLPVDRIASEMGLSLRQLQRIAETELHRPLSGYIAAQRLEQAVLYMQTEEGNLSEVALKVGYENAQSFSKAFRNRFGSAPRTYLKDLQKRLNDSFKTTDCIGEELIPETIYFNGLNLVYIRIRGQYGEPDIYERSWSRLLEFLAENKAVDAETRYIGLSFDDPNVTASSDCFFYACASVGKEIRRNGVFGTMRLPPGRYAVYTLKGSYSDLQPFYNRIAANLKHSVRCGMPFEEYIGYAKENPEAGQTKMYIPIK